MFRKCINIILFSIALVSAALAGELPDFSGLVEKQGPAVVNISTMQHISQQTVSGIPENDPFFDFFRRFAPIEPRDQEMNSLGSGFILSSDGYIMTNSHVVDHADKITVRLTDKREFPARVIGVDRKTDIALLKIDATNLPKVSIGDPNKLKVGEWVVAIGSPFGFDNSVTAGIVSAKGRSLPQDNYVPFIQTDAAINPGNSGGPLFNMNGEVVGINSQIYTRSGGFMGLSFAIPIDVANQVADQLRTKGMVTRGRIGVTIQEMTRQLAESFGLAQPNGALVSSVEKGGPADKAGIEASDVILKFDGKTVANSGDLPRIVAAAKPGSKVLVDLWHKGAAKQVTVLVGRMPDDGKLAKTGKGSSGQDEKSIARLGVALSELTPDQLADMGIKGGLLVEAVKGKSAVSSGIQPGDVIVAMGNVPLSSLKQLKDIVKQLPKGHNVALLVRRDDAVFYVAIRLDDN